MKITLLFALILTTFQAFGSDAKNRSLASIRPDIRKGQALELLGARYKKSVVSHFEKELGLERKIFATVKDRLPKEYKKDAQEIARTIVLEAAKHQLDPYFVMAVISGESSFNPKARGPVGEIGLMQLRPTTGEWMATKSRTAWKGDKTLLDPVKNIKLGTAYLAWLRTKFNGHGQLYLAAYNMGPGSVKNALGRNVWPKDYPKHVMKRYIAFYNEL
jgi:soluble lytic murein transglycosylase